VKPGRDFYCLCSPIELRSETSVKSVYGTIEWLQKFKSAEAKGVTVEHIRCSLDPRHNRGGKRNGNLQLVLQTSHLSDFVWTWMRECVIPNPVLQLFKDTALTGFEPLPAKIEKMRTSGTKASVQIPEAWELVVTGKGGDAHPDSGIRLLYACPVCGYTRYSSFKEGIIVDEEQWDGSDFFKVNGYPNFIMITERVKDIIVENKLTNCAIIRSEDLRWGNIPRPEDHPENFVPTKVVVRGPAET